MSAVAFAQRDGAYHRGSRRGSSASASSPSYPSGIQVDVSAAWSWSLLRARDGWERTFDRSNEVVQVHVGDGTHAPGTNVLPS